MKTIGIMSGKGGVGKSTIAASIALSLVKRYKTGLLDIDLTGPDILEILGKKEVIGISHSLEPAEIGDLKILSLAHIVSEKEPILWSSKDFISVSNQLLDCDWGDTEFLIVDFPPGSETVVQNIAKRIDYALLVTIPSQVSEKDVRRAMNLCFEYGVPILGLVLNFAYFRCVCGRETKIFSEEPNLNLPILLRLPIDEEIANKRIIPDLDVAPLLEAMENPIKVNRLKRKIKRTMIKAILRGAP